MEIQKPWIWEIGADNKTFGERLDDLIKSSGKTQKEVAVAAGITQSALSSYKKDSVDGNARIPKSDIIIKLARYFGVSTDYLLGLTYIKSPRTEIREAANITGLSEDILNNLILLKNADIERLDYYDTDSVYSQAVRKHLFMPTFNALVGHVQFKVFIAQLTEFLIDRDAPKDLGGWPVDYREYASGRRTISAGESSDLHFHRATRILHDILTTPNYEDEIAQLIQTFNSLSNY